MTSIKRKRVTISIDTKLEILSKLDQGVGLGQLAKEYNVGRSTVFDIRKRANKIRQFAREAIYSGSLKRRCIIRRPDDAKFDKAMHLWYCQQRANGTPISSRTFTKKAKMMHAEMYPDRNDGQFKASSGWLYRFRGRHGISHLNMQGERPSADPNVARTTLKRCIEENGLTSDQVFNCGETGLYWRLLPGKTPAHGSENQATVFKSSKHRVTLMATANASGDFRLPLVFIHKRAEPRCFAEVTMSALPCHYYSQRGAWMSGDIFSDWFLKHFVPLVKEYLRRKTLPLRAILLVDNTPAHHAAENLVSETEDGYIRCMFLPANEIGFIQPMDQGVLENVKRRYKRELLRRLWMRSDSFESYSDFCNLLTVKDALHMCAKAWEEVSSVSLKRSWQKLLPGDGQVEDENIEEVDDVSFTEEQRQFAISAEEQEEWLVADKNEGGHRIFTDQEIIQQVCETEPDSDVEEEVERIPHAVAEVCLITSLKWLQQQEQEPEASEQHLHMLRELHALAVRKRERNSDEPVGRGAVQADRSLSKNSPPSPQVAQRDRTGERGMVWTRVRPPDRRRRRVHCRWKCRIMVTELGSQLQDCRFDSQVCEMEPDSDVEEEVERIPHAVAEVCLITSLKWLQQQEPEASEQHLHMLRELHALAVRKRELSAGVLDTKSAAPEHNHIQDLLKVEALGSSELAFGTCLHPDQIGAETVSGEHVKAEQDSESADFNCVESISDKLKCEPTEISIGDYMNTDGCSWG